MKILRQHLNILFSQVQPEYLFNRIICRNEKMNRILFKADPYSLSACFVGAGSYRHYAYGVLSNLNPDEIMNMYADMNACMKEKSACCGGESIFSLLAEYTVSVLEERNGVPYCRREKVLGWRECSLRLGQDMLVTAYLAYQKIEHGTVIRSFCWPAQIHTDDARLNQIMKRGIAENHFHINGSARIFDISWLCLMNHPDRIREYFAGGRDKKNDTEYDRNIRFCEDLYGGTMLGTDDNHWSWENRFYIAAWIRVMLFQWMQNGPEFWQDLSGEMDKLRELGKVSKLLVMYTPLIEKKVQTIRCMYFEGASFPQYKGIRSCLDYAVAADRIKEDRDSAYRILSGERAFLYTAFQWIFSRKIMDEEQNLDFMNLFYLYLLLKTQFRNEIVQLNGRIGFRNFAYYENRKDVLFDIYPDYKLEAYNTSVATALREEHVISHELRVTPKEKPDAMMKYVWNLDQKIGFLLHEKGLECSPEDLKERRREAKYFYTLHFVKRVDIFDESEKWSVLVKPRNSDTRDCVRKQALSIARGMEKYNYLCARIRGIDACNFEIGCRPETFATEFRFLREFVPWNRSSDRIVGKGTLAPRISVTYHAGEDFLDLADGLRAIDETVFFLELHRNDRLGHALALGLSPEVYYQKKDFRLVMPKQVRLDDIIWLLYRSRELGCAIDPILFQKMKDEACQLLNDIFAASVKNPIDLNDYYNSWHIRGDEPELYRYGRYNGTVNNKPGQSQYGLKSQYDYHKILRHGRRDNLDIYRKNLQVSELYAAYHFDYKVRKKGYEMTVVRIEPAYISLISNMQMKMQQEIASEGIAIECNPSSNVLIAPIDRYNEHPIFRFAPIRDGNGSYGGMYVSVNTDDQGVFDTSLVNEYSLLACSLSKQSDANGYPLYSDDEICDYLNRLRENGITQVFPKAQRMTEKDDAKE